MRDLEIPYLDNDSHIIPIHVEDPRLCKEAANVLIEEHGIYIQPVFYPTVPKGDERFRVTITPKHQAEDIKSSCLLWIKYGQNFLFEESQLMPKKEIKFREFIDL